MRPGAVELLNGIKKLISETLLPELQTEQAQQLAMYSTILIDHIAARWEIEGALLLEERAELRELLSTAGRSLGDGHELVPRLRDALAATEECPAGPHALDASTDCMRRLVPVIGREAANADSDNLRELNAAVRSYLHSQHRRDEKIVEVGGLAW